LQAYPDKTIAIVAHGTVISLFVSRITGISDLLLWNELGLPSFVVIDMESHTLIARENVV
jgi:broad specificity phosphatase PhoE